MDQGPTPDTTTSEQFSYRLRKWVIQQLSQFRNADQHQRIESEEWDILIILDACRLDVCREIAAWPVQTAHSPASCTPDWLRTAADAALFSGDAILTANPQYSKFDFGAETVEHYWQTHWDDSLQTVLPEPVLDGVASARENGNESVIAHLQQPHWPYVAKLDRHWELAYQNLGPWNDGEISSMQVAMARGYIDTERAYSAYRASVRSVWRTLLPYIDEWVREGSTVVVTSDHGETFGRLREFTMCEHPCKVNIRPLTRVPWIQFQPATISKHEGESTVKNRLQALGYAE